MMQAKFKNIDVIDGAASLRWTPGIQPSSASVRLQKAPKAGDEGDLTLADGFGKKISATMIVESVEESSSVESGTACDVVLKDLRAFWKFGAITGRYNQPDAAGAPAKEKSLRELAGLCLKAMPRVTAFSVSALPSDEFPAVEWVWENPADALEALLGERFSVIFTFDGKVEIRRANAGADYRSVRPYLSRSLKTSREQEYDGVIVVGDRSIRQVTRVLMAVGLDVDGKWKALKNLSFAPDKTREDGGFGREFARDGFKSIELSLKNRENGEKVVNELLPLILRVYGGIPCDELPLLNEICEKEFDENGIERYRAPYAVGPLAGKAMVNGVAVTVAEDGPLDGYQIDHQRGLVMFREPQTQAPPGEEGAQARTDALPAHLYLVYAFDAKAASGTDVYRCGDLNAKAPLIVRKPELRLREKWPRTVYPLVPVPPPYQRDYAWQALNRADLDEYAKKVHAACAGAREKIRGGSITLIGLKSDLAMDGLFRSATFTVGPRGSTTEIEWGIETPRIEIPTYHERMRIRRADKIAREFAHAGASGKSFGAVIGRQGCDPAKPPLTVAAIPAYVLARNTTNDVLPFGRPIGPYDAQYIDDDGIWNLSYPMSNLSGYRRVMGVSASDIPPGAVGYVKIAPVGTVLVELTGTVDCGVGGVRGDPANVVAGDRLKPAVGAFLWEREATIQPANVKVLKVFAYGARKTAIVSVVEDWIFGP